MAVLSVFALPFALFALQSLGIAVALRLGCKV